MESEKHLEHLRNHTTVLKHLKSLYDLVGRQNEMLSDLTEVISELSKRVRKLESEKLDYASINRP